MKTTISFIALSLLAFNASASTPSSNQQLVRNTNDITTLKLATQAQEQKSAAVLSSILSHMTGTDKDIATHSQSIKQNTTRLNALNNNDQQIAAHTQSIKQNTTRLDALNNSTQKIATHSQSIKQNTTRLDTLDNDAKNESNNVTSNSNSIATSRVQIEKNAKSIAAIDTTNLSSKAEVQELRTSFNQLADKQLQLEGKVNSNEGKMSNGIAGVAAMANIPLVQGHLTVGAGMGYFNGSQAVAVGVSDSFDNGFSVKTSMSYADGKYGQNDVTVGAGVGYSFN